ncbi:MAG TPA: hypothetical protein VGN07_23810 [Steroidobacteraceae bacterium]
MDAGDLLWWDERKAPVSGDLVVIEQHPDRREYCESVLGLKYEAGPVFGIKRLAMRDGEWLLTADDCPEGFPLSDNIIRGPVVFRLSLMHKAGAIGVAQRLARRHDNLAQNINAFVAQAKSPAQKLIARRQLEQLDKIRRKQSEIDRQTGADLVALRKAHCNSISFGPGAMVDRHVTAQISHNAVTDTAVTTEPADGSQAYSSTTQPAIGVVGLNGLASYTSPEGTATQVDVSWSAQARISNTTSGVAVGKARLRIRVFINSSEVFNSELILESYTATDNWGPFSGTRSFSVPAGQTLDAYIQTDRNFTTSGASPAQTMFWREALVNLVPSKR